MNYIEIAIVLTPYSAEIAEILTAELAESGFESFSDTDNCLNAYVQVKEYKKNEVENILATNRFDGISISWDEKLIEAQNWNALWESNFEPITVKDQILVKAPFHSISDNYKHTITIEPKMSFGTGHHETTSLMMEQMLGMSFENKSVLDMGCGTGILAILAHQLGGTDITAIDFDEWAYENSIENFERNNCTTIKALLGDATVIPNQTFDIIIANINRNVLLADISVYTKYLKNGGYLLLSGFYTTDIEAIENEANLHSFIKLKVIEKNNWVSCLFIKS